jgi:hypothetical protein
MLNKFVQIFKLYLFNWYYNYTIFIFIIEIKHSMYYGLNFSNKTPLSKERDMHV